MFVFLPTLCHRLPALILVATCALLIPLAVYARNEQPRKPDKELRDPDRVLVLDGDNIHNVGELQMHVGNWGEFGSRPDTGLPFSWGPSAQWPAGSGIEYLFTAGLWVGALKLGVPAVSTAAFDQEFRPTQDRRDIIYRASDGDRGGNRQPHPQADDDADGSIDEDCLDGFDNDLDGSIDEDFAAISRLMFACRYSDMESVSQQIYTEHDPLGIVVRQESYQWSADPYDDFVGVEYHITNAGSQFLQDVYVGLFVDGDAGPRDRSNYWEDDLVARHYVPVACTAVGPVQFDFAYTFDADGDDGTTPGLFGIVLLDHPTDPIDGTAPSQVGFRTFNYFAGHQSFEDGGDPTNDFERYELLASGGIEREPELPRDYRMLVSVGPFAELRPESTIVVQYAFVIGEGDDAFANAARAKRAFEGAWFDLDKEAGIRSGYSGRETQFFGGLGVEVWVDSCRLSDLPWEQGCDTERADEMFNDPIKVLEGQSTWSNTDCELECLYKAACGYYESDSLVFRTGVAGRESQVNWIMAAAPPPPHMRIDDHARDGIVVYWDSSSEAVLDNITLEIDFEGYQLFRADEWQRPLGTSKSTGPPTELWSALHQADLINRNGEDTGLDHLRYEPLLHILTAQQKYGYLNTLLEFIRENPDEDPPCPPGVTAEVCDTLVALARGQAGIAGGRHYYRYIDTSVHLGRPYFYSVIAIDHGVTAGGEYTGGLADSPASNFLYVEPKSSASEPHEYHNREIYVVPNPATRESMATWALDPTNDDPSGIKVEFRNLPAAPGMIRIFTLAGDLVQELRFDGRGGVGTKKWDLVTRSGQEVTSGVYLYAVDADDKYFKRVIGKFTVIR